MNPPLPPGAGFRDAPSCLLVIPAQILNQPLILLLTPNAGVPYSSPPHHSPWATSFMTPAQLPSESCGLPNLSPEPPFL